MKKKNWDSLEMKVKKPVDRREITTALIRLGEWILT